MGARNDDDDAWRIRLDRSIGGRMLHLTTPRSFAILRCAKIKTMGNMGASLQHTFRERDTPNADTRRTPDNTVLVGGETSRAVLDAWKDRAPEKIRSNAVHGLEYFVGGSPEALKAMSREEQDAYFTDALDWLKARHGAENVLSAVIHRDESTPHMTVMTIPLDERGKLNARAIVGSRQQLSAMQTDFAERVGVKYGLDRGIERSGARHETIRTYYGRATGNETLSLTLPERARGGFLGRGGETDAEYRERLSEVASEAVRAVAGSLAGERDAIAQELAEAKLRAANSEAKAQRLEQSLKVLEVVCNVANYEGPDQQKILDRFHAQYLELAAKLPVHVRYAVDGILNENDKKRFEEIEVERAAAERRAQEREIAASRERDRAAKLEHEAREKAEHQQTERDRERDGGWER